MSRCVEVVFSEGFVTPLIIQAACKAYLSAMLAVDRTTTVREQNASPVQNQYDPLMKRRPPNPRQDMMIRIQADAKHVDEVVTVHVEVIETQHLQLVVVTRSFDDGLRAHAREIA
jgi:hypothetical protein